MPPSTRRALLGCLAGGLVGLAGCNQGEPDAEPTPPSRTTSPPTTTTTAPTETTRTTGEPASDCVVRPAPVSGWPQPGRDARGTNYAPDGAVGRSKPALRWSVRANGSPFPEFTRPVVADGTAYVGMNVQTGPEARISEEQYVHAYDLATGERLFRYRAGDPVSSGPALVGGTVVFTAADGVHALWRADGSHRWTTGLGSDGRSLAVSNGRIYVASAETLRCLGLDGEAVWSVDVPGDQFFDSLAAVGDAVYAGTGGGHLLALDAADGSERWTDESFADEVADVTATRCGVFVETNVFHALDADGRRRFEVLNAEDVLATDGRVAYVLTDTGRVRALDLADGTTVWQSGRDGVESTAVLAGERLHVVSDGRVVALDATTGSERWVVDAEPLSPVGGSPELVAADGWLLAAVEDRLFAFS